MSLRSLKVMGVLNVTPDSFYDGGRYVKREQAVSRALKMEEEGAHLIDVGGESTRPGSEPVDKEVELSRVIPVVRELSKRLTCARISIDTQKPEVARAAVAEGASLINDVSGTLWEVAAQEGVGWVCMHRKGEPRTMNLSPQYDDVVAEVSQYLRDRLELARRAGVSELYVDPGFGFGKSPFHNALLLSHLEAFKGLGAPVLVGLSRKSSIGIWASFGAEPLAVEERLAGSLAAAVIAVLKGAAVVRVHDVAPTVQALAVLEKLLEVG